MTVARRRATGLSRVLAVLTVVAAALAGGSAAPAAADPGSCTPTVGVVVVVDFRPFGGGIQRGCDPTPTTGFEAMHTAGFTTVGTQHDGPGFICRINGLPTAATEPCITTPPANHYWSYWHALAGQTTWSYSQLGATSYAPPAGSVDAWVYGATDVSGGGGGPSFSPGSVRATSPAPATPAPTSAASGGGSTGGGGTGGSAGTTSSAASAPKAGSAAGSAAKAPATTAPARTSPSTPSASSTPADPSNPPNASGPSSTPSATTTSEPSSVTSTTPADGTSSTASSGALVTDIRAAPTAATPAPGSAWPTVVAIVVVLALGCLTALLAIRRKRTG